MEERSGAAGGPPEVTGRTRLYAILADPIAHVKTPQTMHALFARHGIDGVLVPMHVAPDDLAVTLDGLRGLRNFGGFIATVPHKGAMRDLCDEVSAEAEAIGAVNCVRRDPDGRMIGAMLDGTGFVEGLASEGIDLDGRRVLLAGAGGAASAIAFSVASRGAARLTIANRTVEKAERLAERVRAHYPGLEVSALGSDADPGAQEIVVNATSLGMRPDDPLPVPRSVLERAEVVAEVIMDPVETPLLAAARAAGCRAHPGLPMLERQIELMARHMGALT
ncbi:shikimate dehydrogenase [Palleronia aestuarii]|uniref:shikimate dehydrogenase (NADP(+)) n=1 Tax=Palleronia aestuarii TaxID=568105 RepID=A0A2W7N9Q7_9RHOB|nr:shikimate dehydrogenase [Palleronia aestuarii]PZX17155.1 shikimate dehydrogenase [Palleronia aestuarii]